MPTSNETRVRVEGRSKIIASVLPASGREAGSAPLTRAAFIAAAVVEDAAQFPARKLEQIEEMPRGAMNGRVHSLNRFQFIATTNRSWMAAQAASSRRTPSAISSSATIRGGKTRTTLSPAGMTSSF